MSGKVQKRATSAGKGAIQLQNNNVDKSLESTQTNSLHDKRDCNRQNNIEHNTMR